MILGYTRVLTSAQSLEGQRDALKEAGAGRLYADAITGTAPSSTSTCIGFGTGVGTSPVASRP